MNNKDIIEKVGKELHVLIIFEDIHFEQQIVIFLYISNLYKKQMN